MHRVSQLCTALALLAALSAARAARADDTVVRARHEAPAEPVTGANEAPLHLRLDVGTDVPLDAGARLRVEGPARLRLASTIGWVPRAYVNAMEGVLEDAGALNATAGTIVKESFSSSLVWRTHAGWRPFPSLGFYGEAGYGLLALGAGVSVGTLATATHSGLPPFVDPKSEIGLRSVLHMLDVELGWEHTLAEHVGLRLALGGAFTMGATTRVDPQFDVPYRALVQPYFDRATGQLDHVYRSYVFTPVVSASVGYVVF